MYTEEILEGMTLEQLRMTARQLDIPGRSQMSREDLINAILAYEGAVDEPEDDDPQGPDQTNSEEAPEEPQQGADFDEIGFEDGIEADPQQGPIVREGMPKAQKAAIAAVVLGVLLLMVGAIVLFGMKGCDNSKISEGTYEQESIPADYEPEPIKPGGGRSWADVIAFGDAHPAYWQLAKIVTRGEVDRAYAVKSLEAERSGRNMLVTLREGTVVTNSEYLKDRDEYRVLRGYRLKKDRQALIGYDGKPRALTECLNWMDFCSGEPWTPCKPDQSDRPDKPDEPEECYVPDDTSEYHTPSNPAYQPPVPIPGVSDPTPGYIPETAEDQDDSDQGSNDTGTGESGTGDPPPGSDNGVPNPAPAPGTLDPAPVPPPSTTPVDGTSTPPPS